MLQIRPPIYKNLFSLESQTGSYKFLWSTQWRNYVITKAGHEKKMYFTTLE